MKVTPRLASHGPMPSRPSLSRTKARPLSLPPSDEMSTTRLPRMISGVSGVNRIAACVNGLPLA